MDVVYACLAIIFVGLMALAIFVLGALFAVRLLTDAQDDARYDRLRQEYYMLAKYRHPGDPRPYVPPKSAVIPSYKTPRNRYLPGMSALDRVMKEGKRGVIMWRPEDRNAG